MTPTPTEPLTNVEKLRLRFERLRAEGLRDLKVWVPDTQGASVEALAGELLDILDSVERGDFVEIPPEKLR